MRLLRYSRVKSRSNDKLLLNYRSGVLIKSDGGTAKILDFRVPRKIRGSGAYFVAVSFAKAEDGFVGNWREVGAAIEL